MIDTFVLVRKKSVWIAALLVLCVVATGVIFVSGRQDGVPRADVVLESPSTHRNPVSRTSLGDLLGKNVIETYSAIGWPGRSAVVGLKEPEVRLFDPDGQDQMLRRIPQRDQIVVAAIFDPEAKLLHLAVAPRGTKESDTAADVSYGRQVAYAKRLGLHVVSFDFDRLGGTDG